MKFIEDSTEKGDEFKNDLKNAKKETLKLLDEVKNSFIYEVDISRVEEFHKVPSAGVDGSNQVVGGKFGKFFILLASGISKFLDGPLNECEMEFSDVKTLSYFDPVEKKVYSVAEDLMLELETKAIYHFINKESPTNSPCYLILDGPIVDPPRYPLDYERSDNNYIKYRTKAILNGITKEPPIVIAGYNKRIMGYYFKKHIESELGKKIKTVYSDFDVLSIIFLELLNRDPSKVYFTKPIKNTESNIYEEYEKEGLIIYSSYSMFSPRSPLFRVDIAVTGKLSYRYISKMMEETILLLKASTLPGLWYPIQITTVHEKVSIRRGAAEVLYNEILTRAASTSEDMISTLVSYLIE
ncbi:MAG: DNA double-strand break repair nuclease NurA [Elusimicrobiota bacterium]